MRPIILAAAAAVLLAPAACSKKEATAPEAAAPAEEGITHVSAEGDFAENLQLALIEAEPGDTIVMPEGTFAFTTGLSLDVDGVTLAGAGQGRRSSTAGRTGAGEPLGDGRRCRADGFRHPRHERRRHQVQGFRPYHLSVPDGGMVG
ncbi:MAG: hypothetical protein R3B94_08855 [Hyphomonas sp.]